MILGTAAAVNRSQQHFTDKPRPAEYREARGQDGSFTAERQRSEQMMNTSGLLWGATG